jgi:hypothetical protein
MGISRTFTSKANSGKTFFCGIPVRFSQKLQRQIHILKGRKGGEEIKKLKDKSEASAPEVGSPFLPKPFQIMTVHLDTSFCGPVKPGDEVKERCLARTTLSEKGNDFSWHYFEVRPPEGNTVLSFITILFPEVYDANHWFHLGPSLSAERFLPVSIISVIV